MAGHIARNAADDGAFDASFGLRRHGGRKYHQANRGVIILLVVVLRGSRWSDDESSLGEAQVRGCV